jgi:uncharacterized protein YndB with AHSA1/START domain
MTDPTQQSSPALRIERTYDAPARVVFDAWTNPEVMRRWWHAGPDWETTEAEADVRVGGSYRVVMRRPTGEEYGGSGEYTVVEPPERLAFTWAWDDEDDGLTSLLELEFRERDGATTVVLTHSGLRSDESAQSHTEGWNLVLDNLERVLEA